MNLAAAGGTPAFVLFGSTPVQTYSRFIHAIEPDDGRVRPRRHAADFARRGDGADRALSGVVKA